MSTGLLWGTLRLRLEGTYEPEPTVAAGVAVTNSKSIRLILRKQAIVVWKVNDVQTLHAVGYYVDINSNFSIDTKNTEWNIHACFSGSLIFFSENVSPVIEILDEIF